MNRGSGCFVLSGCEFWRCPAPVVAAATMLVACAVCGGAGCSAPGWATHRKGLPTCTEADKASWTTGAYSEVWLASRHVMGVMPFMLQDAVWGDQDGYR